MKTFLCEKPSQARDIARVLGANRRSDGCFLGSNVVVTWCIGHLVEAANPEAYAADYKRWSIESLPIIPTTWRIVSKKSTAAQFAIVKRLISQATALVIATDADREGEMIARELLDLFHYRGPVQRLWLSALNDASIRRSLDDLRPGDQTMALYHAALARSRADWLVGINLTRLFTLLGRTAGYDGVLSVGRVQTPTLQLVVQRDREISNFKPMPHWAVTVDLAFNGHAFTAQWIPSGEQVDSVGRCIHEGLAHACAEQLRQAADTRVSSLESETVRELPPLPFDLSTLQEVCSRQLGLDVAETLNVAQALYETHKATTYPRTDAGYLPESMFSEAPAVLEALLATDPTLKPLYGSLDTSLRSRAWNDAKIRAHHGIIPTSEPTTLSAMSEKERAVYVLIRSHFLAQFLPPHEFERATARLLCAGQSLKAIGRQVKILGWRKLFTADRATGEDTEGCDDDPRNQTLPRLLIGSHCEIIGVDFKSLTTEPPRPYTQGDLVKAMKGIARTISDPALRRKLNDTTGIGTEATRAGIIQGLITRGYLATTRRAVRATQAAFALIDAVPPAIADPNTTATWEQALDGIAEGRVPLDTFVSNQASWVAQVVRQYAGARLVAESKDTPECPICNARMRQRTGKHGMFWSCTRYPDCRGSRPTQPHPSRRRTRR